MMEHHGVARTRIELAIVATEILAALQKKYGDIRSLRLNDGGWHARTMIAMFQQYDIEIDVWGRYIITTADSEIVERGTLNQLRGNTTLA